MRNVRRVLLAAEPTFGGIHHIVRDLVRHLHEARRFDELLAMYDASL